MRVFHSSKCANCALLVICAAEFYSWLVDIQMLPLKDHKKTCLVGCIAYSYLGFSSSKLTYIAFL